MRQRMSGAHVSSNVGMTGHWVMWLGPVMLAPDTVHLGAQALIFLKNQVYIENSDPVTTYMINTFRDEREGTGSNDLISEPTSD